MFEVSPLPGNYPFGAVVTGLTFDDLDDVKTREALYRLWIEKGVLVFKALAGDRDLHVKLSEVFGETIPHAIVETRMPGYPKLISLENNDNDCDIYKVGGEVRAGHIPWHTDGVFTSELNRGGILRAIEVPERGGYTGFIDQISSYDSLDEDIKEKIENLRVAYKLNFDCSQKKFGKTKLEVIQICTMAQKVNANLDNYNPVSHPMVFAQPETGRKVLNVSPLFALYIEGMQTPEGDALLSDVIDHLEANERAYYHHWQAGDYVLWDNWRMLHSAYGIELGQRRKLERTTIAGDYGLGRTIEVVKNAVSSSNANI